MLGKQYVTDLFISGFENAPPPPTLIREFCRGGPRDSREFRVEFDTGANVCLLLLDIVELGSVCVDLKIESICTALVRQFKPSSDKKIKRSLLILFVRTVLG